MSNIKQKLKQKILSKGTLSLQDKLLLEKIENIPEEEIISQLLVKKLNKINLLIENLEKKDLYGTISYNETEQLEHIIEKKKEIINKIRELRENKELSIEDFGQTNNIDILNFNGFNDFLSSVGDKVIDSIKDDIIDIGKDLIIDSIFNN